MFFGREDDLQAMGAALLERSVLLVGARRVGKTELLKHIGGGDAGRLVPVRVDLQGLDRDVVRGAAGRLRQALTSAGLLGAAGEAAKDELRRVERIEAAGVSLQRTLPGGDPWIELEQLLKRSTAELDGERVLVLMLDEVPWWLDALRDEVARAEDEKQAKAALRGALAKLRHLRERDDLAGKLRMVLTGSVGLAGVAAEVGAAADVNDLHRHELRPLAEIHGCALVEATLADHGEVTEAARLEIHRRAGGSPFWIKQIVGQLTGDAIDLEDVNEATERLLSPRSRELFQDEGHDHLLRRHPARARALQKMLAFVAHAPNPTWQLLVNAGVEAGLPTRHSANEAGYVLVDEFYLEREGDRLRFVNPLFRLWWQRYGPT